MIKINNMKCLLSSYRLFIRQPNTVDVDWGNFLQPFEPSLWLSILVVILVVSVLVEVCHQLSRHFGTCSAEQQYRPFFHDSLFHVFSAFCSQGTSSILQAPIISFSPFMG
jgi:hypothetical protein